MKRFSIKVLAFSIPILLIGIIPFLFLYSSGEFYRSIDKVVQKNENYLIGYSYHEHNYNYIKQKEIESRNQLSIIALGSSRILQFRGQMFTKTFYNAGFTIISIADFIPFIKSNLSKNKPEILLIALDQWMFNENWDNLSDYNFIDKNWDTDYVRFPKISMFKKVYFDLINHEYGFNILTVNKVNDIKKYGFNAIINNYGFRKDGSVYYGDQIKKLLVNDSTLRDYNNRYTYFLMDQGTLRFEYGDNVNEKSLKALHDILSYCKANNIYVVAILPPYASKVNERLKESGKYKYLDSIYIKCNDLFKEQDFELWDMTHLEKYDSNDLEVLDGFHAGEVSYLKMLIYMVENGSILRNYTDKAKLLKDLRKRKNNYEVYGYD